MKIKLLPLLAGVTVLTLGFTPMIVSAQQGERQGRPPRMERLQSELNLTDAQRNQFEQLHEQTREQIKNILTSEQQQTVRNAIAQGQNPRQAMRSINLTEQQREQMRSIRQQTREQMQNLLTPEQRQRMQELKESRQGRRGQRREGRSQR
ncbi:Spy/CpxP family protein refolding chaperone [Lusitaniella coriacea LEGE 07157]|uniref:Spy/CpxP family protein refolding chaperone n=1 Tax=Lusitaniella coriacea LEGE 07157 TaxID=945747 RepID=A0A8J7DVU7_9CYAN|nr:Spy/CpxP family protein refolding chaperone [Lusitaniella coriacea]MBE9115962.1 Spy/CpxP family protein refolding chaperone [Lusitaniella coriacea LEGE 07157]